ncbi:MAG: DUF5675 family protein [Spirochaetales bacterium]|nr:DUF5675 family protein [Spirochaetales bacterium]
MQLILNRIASDGVEALGTLRVYDGSKLKAIFSTLEPVYEDGKPKIPLGNHKLLKYYSPKFQMYLWRFNTNKEEWARAFEIHIGNTVKDSLGCLLLGNGFANIDNDQEIDVINSKGSFKKLMKLTEGLQELDILIK